MARLLVHVEGQTEERFVNEVLRPFLVSAGYHSVSARIVGNARQRERKHGILAWSAVRSDIVRHLKEDLECFATTMVDYYGLPDSGERAWPGRAEASRMPFEQRAPRVEDALRQDVRQALGRDRRERFVPFVMMHEFEALLFSDCSRLAAVCGRPDLESSLTAIRSNGTPEEIDDSPEGAPSKRILKLMPGYRKPLIGMLAALDIGLTRMRLECPHFDSWLRTLESLAPK